jgi:flagella basal body P-ring formation protein FlgA
MKLLCLILSVTFSPLCLAQAPSAAGHLQFHLEPEMLRSYIMQKIDTFHLNQNRFRLTLEKAHLSTETSFEAPVTSILCPDLEILTEPRDEMRPWMQKFAQNRPLLCEIQLSSHTSKSVSLQTQFLVESLVLITTQAIATGTPITQDLLENSWKPFSYADAQWIHRIEEIPPQAVSKQDLPEGASLKKNSLFRPYGILRGQMTTLQIRNGNITLSSKVKALENGYLGEYAMFLRPDSKKRLSAKIYSSELVKME